jgi:hypothetical protein
MRRALCFSLLSLLGWAEMPHGLPGCSGMAAWGPDNYIICRDFKVGETGERLGLVETGKGLTYRSIEIDWGEAGEANDLESVAPLQGQPDEFLAAESGYVDGKFGRIFHFSASAGRFRCQHTYRLPEDLSQEIEGLATRKLSAERWMILIGGRRGKGGEPGRIFWGFLQNGQIDWPKAGRLGIELHTPRRLGPFARTLSDMYLDEQDRLYVASCSSPGKAGPNRSLIYHAGDLDPEANQPLHRASETQNIWWVDGVKIEGLAPCSRAGYGPAYASEDNDLGGIWRAVPASPSLSY